jgi:nicotinic acid phosphoribosyltransferase
MTLAIYRFFFLTYAAIVFEHPLGVNKSAAKLSDSPGKGMCDDEKYLAYLRQVFEIEQPN